MLLGKTNKLANKGQRYSFAKVCMNSFIALLLLGSAMTVPKAAFAESHAGVWKKTNTQLRLTDSFLDINQFTTLKRSMNNQGWILRDLEPWRYQSTNGTYGVANYRGVFQKTSNSRVNQPPIQYEFGWVKFINRYRTLKQQGFRLIDVEHRPRGSGGPNGEAWFGVFQRGNWSQRLYFLESIPALQAKHAEQENVGYRLGEVEPIKIDGKLNFVALFHKSSGTGPLRIFAHENSQQGFDQFIADKQNQAQQGYQLEDYERVRYAGRTYFFGVYKKDSYHELMSRTGSTSLASFNDQVREYRQDGFKILDLEVDSAID